jgi:hypothetical protein
MAYFWHGTNLLTLGEWGGTSTKQDLSGYKISGADVQFVTTTNGYIYDGTFIPTGYKKSGTQLVLQNPGCRPHTGNSIWASGGSGTAYIHRYPNGAVYVTGATTHVENTSDTRISWPTDSANFPRGVRFLIVQLCGGGGGGGARGLAVTYSNHGGSGAAVACLIKLPADGYATLTVGNSGSASGSGALKDGGSGGASKITCGTFWAQAGGGGGANGGGNNSGSAGTWSCSGDNADGKVLASTNGSAGSTSAKNVSYTDPCPEAGTKTTRAGGAGGRGGTSGAYGSGSAGGVGVLDLFY